MPAGLLRPLTRWARVGKDLPPDPMAAARHVNRIIKPMRAVGGLGGGMAGYQAGDDPNLPEGERLLHAAGGAALGGFALPGLARTAMMAKNFPDLAVNGLYYSYLSSPDTIARANLGALGGVLNRGAEQLVMGDIVGASKTLGAMAGGANVWVKSLMGSPETVRKLRHQIIGIGPGGRIDVPDEAFRDVGLGKWFTAGDNAAVYVMKKSGMTAEEGMRYTLTGTPETEIGKGIVGLQSKWLRSGTTAQRVAAATLAPFARVGVQGIEQGLKRIPGLGMFKTMGGPGWGKILQFQHDATKQAWARQIVGGGAMAGGAAAEDKIDPRISLVLSTIFGPAFLPYTMGREFKRQRQRGPNIPAAMAGAFGEGIMEFSPLGYQPLGILRSVEELPRRLIPSAVGDVAEAMDPAFGRKQGRRELEMLADRGEVPGWMGQPMVGAAMARIPGLRGKLPEEFPPVDIFGQPRYPQPEALPGADTSPLMRGLSRALTPSRASAEPPAQNLLDPRMRQLYDLGIRPGPPSQRVEMPGIGGQIKMPAATVAAVQQLRGASRERTAQILSQLTPWLMSLPPHQRAIMAQYLNARINQAQGPFTRAATLGTALSGGGQLPRF